MSHEPQNFEKESSVGAEPDDPAASGATVDPWRAPDVSSGKSEGDENFPVGSILFPKVLREHVHAYYKFARISDDVTDSSLLSPEEKVARLDAMEAILRGEAEAPDRADARSCATLRVSLLRTGLPFEVATDLLIAFRQDATKARYATFEELLDYCRYSANPVGRYLLLLHGEHERTFPASDALCTSLQILNHLQDCKEDLRTLKRSYLPLDLLARHGLDADAVLAARMSPELRAVFDTLLDEVDALNEKAARLVSLVHDRRMRMYCGAVVNLAFRLATRLRAGDPLAERVAPGRADFARAALAAAAACRAAAGRKGARASSAEGNDMNAAKMAQPLGCGVGDLARVEGIVLQAGTSFAAGMRVLPEERRFGMYAVYAFCRIVDDIADGDAAPSRPGAEGEADRVAQLDAWRARVARLFAEPEAGVAEDSLDRVLRATIRRFDLRQADFEAIIDGMAMDACGPVVAPDEATLDQYCDRVASAVGRLSVRVFGDTSEMADKVAFHLGRALQLTNILRDIEEDARLGRLYLPRELLTRYDVPLEPRKALTAPGLAGVATVLAVRADDHFRQAFAAMAQCDRRAMIPARMMGGSYAAILKALRQRGWADITRPVRVGKFRKIASVARAFVA